LNDYPTFKRRFALPDIKTGLAFHACDFERIPVRLIDQPPIENKGNLARIEKVDLADTGHTIKGRVAFWVALRVNASEDHFRRYA